MGTKVLKTIYIVDIYQCMLISSKALKYFELVCMYVYVTFERRKRRRIKVFISY